MMSRRRQEVSSVRISDEEYSRLQNKFEALKNEFIACKRKLESKCEALLILSKELDQCRSERDQFKLMAEQLRERHQSMKKQLSGGQYSEPGSHAGPIQYSDKQSQNLVKLLYEARDQTKSLEFELDDTKQKLSDAQGDIKLLREQIARQRVGTTDEGMNTRHFPAHEREELVQKLESSREQYLQLERDLQTVLDEKEELVTERDVYKTKYERLNQELNYILKGDENRVVDIDALVMENKYLQDRMKQMEEEKSMAMAAVTKYKSILEKRKNKSCMKLGQSRGGGMVISQKQVHEVLTSKAAVVPTAQAMSDLQALAGALLDTVNDKNLALSHQRKTNKILGNRVAELEKKIKTLEVAGLWNVSGHGPLHLEKLLQECNEMKTLIPQRVSHQSESDQLSVSDEEKDSELGSVTPLDSCATSPEPSPTHTAKNPDHLQLGDLDLLPTKEVACKPASGDTSTETDLLKASQSPYAVSSLDKHTITLACPDESSFNLHPSSGFSSGCSTLAKTNSSNLDKQSFEKTNTCDTLINVADANGESKSAVQDVSENKNNVHDICENSNINDIEDNDSDSSETVQEELYNSKSSENVQSDSEGNDQVTDCNVHVYSKDKVDDDINGEDDDEEDVNHLNINLNLSQKGDNVDAVNKDILYAGGDADSLYNDKLRMHVNGNTTTANGREHNVNDGKFSEEEEEDDETSERIGLLVESMAQKMCNISHKTLQKLDSTEIDGDDLEDSSSKLLQDTKNESGENESTVTEDDPHNVEC